MKRFLSALFVCLMNIVVSSAQDATYQSNTLTAFKSFMPARVTLKNGKTLKVLQANIFLKNSSLLYKSGAKNLQANMDNIAAVDINGCHYIHVDSVLAQVIDTLGSSRLLCAPMLDMEAFEAQMASHREFTRIDISSMVSVTMTEFESAKDNGYPITNHYYFLINDRLVKASERSCLRMIPKDKRRLFKTMMESGTFDWNEPQSLMKILKLMVAEP